MRKKISEYIVSLESGGRPSGGGHLEGDIPSLGAEHLTNEGSLDLSKLKFIPKEFYKRLTKGKININDILIVKDGATTGKVAFVNHQFPFKEASINEHVFILRADVAKIDSKYLFYFLYSSYGKEQILLDFRGSTVGGISRGFIEYINLPLPDLRTQKQIAQVLEDADRARQQRKAANALTEQFLQSSFLHLFGDPVKNEKGWELKKLEELGKWQSGGTPSRKVEEFFGGTIPWYTSGELNQMFVSKSSEYITEQAIKNSNAKLVEPNNLLLGMYDTAALKSSITTINSACNQAIAYSKLENGNANIFYVYHAIQYGKEHFRSQQRGVRQKNLNLTMIKELQLPLPPFPLQQHFASLVADAEILRQKQQQS